jgi:hypothetical protein
VLLNSLLVHLKLPPPNSKPLVRRLKLLVPPSLKQRVPPSSMPILSTRVLLSWKPQLLVRLMMQQRVLLSWKPQLLVRLMMQQRVLLSWKQLVQLVSIRLVVHYCSQQLVHLSTIGCRCLRRPAVPLLHIRWVQPQLVLHLKLLVQRSRPPLQCLQLERQSWRLLLTERVQHNLVRPSTPLVERQKTLKAFNVIDLVCVISIYQLEHWWIAPVAVLRIHLHWLQGI